MYVCMYVYFHICMHVRACVCVYVYTYVQYFFLTSNLLHLESSIYIGLLAYMRTHARQHLKLEVRHKNSHGRIHTHKCNILNGQTHSHKHAHTCMHACLSRRHTFIPYTHAGCTHVHIYIQCRPRSDAVYCGV